MPTVCRLIATQEIINSCQGDILPGKMTAQAVAEGIALASEIEEMVLTVAEFRTLMNEYAVTHPPAPDPLLPLIRSFAQKMIALGFTKAELRAVFRYIAGKIE